MEALLIGLLEFRLSDRKLTGVHGALDIRERRRWQSCWDCHNTVQLQSNW